MVFNKDTFITVMINGWDKYNIRSKDVKKPHWFSCSNNLLEDPDLENFSNSELNVWLFLLSLGSKHVSPVFTVGWKLATRMRRRFRVKDFISAIEKLQIVGFIEVEYQTAAMIRPAHGHGVASTLHNRTIHNNTGGDHVQIFEKRFDQKSLDEIQAILNHVYENNVPPDIRNIKARILHAYGTPENFRTCLTDIINNDGADPVKNSAKYRNYISVSLKKQIGLIQNAS